MQRFTIADPRSSTAHAHCALSLAAPPAGAAAQRNPCPAARAHHGAAGPFAHRHARRRRGARGQPRASGCALARAPPAPARCAGHTPAHGPGRVSHPLGDAHRVRDLDLHGAYAHRGLWRARAQRRHCRRAARMAGAAAGAMPVQPAPVGAVHAGVWFGLAGAPRAARGCAGGLHRGRRPWRGLYRLCPARRRLFAHGAARRWPDAKAHGAPGAAPASGRRAGKKRCRSASRA